MHRYRALGIKEGKSKWRLFFKIFCFLSPDRIAQDTVEGSFLFEQVFLFSISSPSDLHSIILYFSSSSET